MMSDPWRRSLDLNTHESPVPLCINRDAVSRYTLSPVFRRTPFITSVVRGWACAPGSGAKKRPSSLSPPPPDNTAVLSWPIQTRATVLLPLSSRTMREYNQLSRARAMSLFNTYIRAFYVRSYCRGIFRYRCAGTFFLLPLLKSEFHGYGGMDWTGFLMARRFCGDIVDLNGLSDERGGGI